MKKTDCPLKIVTSGHPINVPFLLFSKKKFFYLNFRKKHKFGSERFRTDDLRVTTPNLSKVPCRLIYMG